MHSLGRCSANFLAVQESLLSDVDEGSYWSAWSGPLLQSSPATPGCQLAQSRSWEEGVGVLSRAQRAGDVTDRSAGVEWRRKEPLAVWLVSQAGQGYLMIDTR